MIRTSPLLCVGMILLQTLFSTAEIQISNTVALQIGNKIWKNECGGTINGLTSWNNGENFASLGICHFIWYPAGEKKVFDESFPTLLQFLQQNRVFLPPWLQKNPPCPWKNKDEFSAAIINPQETRMVELKKILHETIPLQAKFAIQRLQNALPLMLEKAKPEDRKRISEQFQRISQIPAGLYALVDYVNFKGEGVKETEQYNHQGWGLLQVLEQMHGEGPQGALFEFSRAAEFVLERRVKNAPVERHEERWLPGWKNRVKGYFNYNLE